ncbi:lysylphosphatidylglycerol synthase domain-containing protein [Pseudonocardia sp. RS010]|uniref:lysylphosphatidylglycerol synthase domain-containing protein n=1 Tax=Pseudonocardia sp. RS010 TaxID=3385979 RepID=UPI0039A30D50
MDEGRVESRVGTGAEEPTTERAGLPPRNADPVDAAAADRGPADPGPERTPEGDEPEATESGAKGEARVRSLRRFSVGRRPGDVVRVVVAAVVVTLCTLLAGIPGVNPVEAAIFEEIGALPAGWAPVAVGLLWVGTWAGVAGAAGLALYLKHIRAALQLVAAGAVAWLVTVGIDQVVPDRPVPPELAVETGLRLPGPEGFGFPATHTAVAAALVTAAAPYLPRKAASAAWLVTVAVALAEVYSGALPLAVFAGAIVGWGAGSASHLVGGAPGRRTSVVAVRRTLEDAGLCPDRIEEERGHLLAPHHFTITTRDGRVLRARTVARLHRRAGPWYRLRRLLATVEVQDVPRLSSTHHEVEHEAYVSRLAERAGARTPHVELACMIEHGSPLLVHQQVEGRRLAELRPGEIDDRLVDAVFAQVAILGRAHLAHHDLQAENILVDADGNPWLLNFTFGQVGAAPTLLAQDLADVLITLVSLVGVDRTVEAAHRTLSADRLEAALAYLQPLALHRGVREQILDGHYLFSELREALADRIGRPLPSYPSPVRPRALVSMLFLGGAIYLLLPQLADIPETVALLRDANWWWLGLAVFTGMVAIAMSAVSLLGSSDTHLPFRRTLEVQVAAAFTGRTTPGGVGFFAINIAFMEKLGMRRSLAVGVTMLNLAATGAVSAVICVVGVFAVGITGTLGGIRIPTGWPLLGAVGGILVLAGLVLGSPMGRRRIVRPGLQVVRELWGAIRRPLRAVQLFGGATAYHVVSALGLATCLAAFDPHFPWLEVLVVFVVGQTLGHLAPTPGGLGAVEALLVAGMIAVGVAPAPAVAATLTSRLLTYWLPVLPGIGVFRYLQHRGVV